MGEVIRKTKLYGSIKDQIKKKIKTKDFYAKGAQH